MHIPPDFIDQVISRTDIVALIREYVTLTQKGSEFKGLCPFHGEKTPSFSVSQEKNVYHCFGCNAGGGVVNFVMEIEGLEYVPAVEFLANRAGLTMPTGSYDDGKERALQAKILNINKMAARFYYQCLQDVRGQEALAYLQGRGLSAQVLTRFGLGFAPNEWDGLVKYMASQGIGERELLDAGLASHSKKTGQVLDRFRNRIMFPIINVKKEVIGFGGRIMDDSQPKYLNSPDTPVFNKSKNLYGLNLAKKPKNGIGILTEGYMDTIALHQAEFNGAVASLGTAFTESQAMLLKRYFKHIVIAYDSDGAGLAATERAIPLFNKVGVDVRILQVHQAKDPDEFIKKYGRDSFTHLLNQSIHHVDFRLNLMKNKHNLEDNGERVYFLQEAARFLATMESPIQREIYATKVGEWVTVSKEAVLLEVDKELEQKKRQSKRQIERKMMNPAGNIYHSGVNLYDCTRASRAEEGLLRVCIQEPNLLSELEDFTSSVFSVPFLGKVFDTIKQRHKEGVAIDTSYLSPFFSPEEMTKLADIVKEIQERDSLQQAMTDYLEVMEIEFERRFLQGDAKLLALQKQKQERKE